LLLQEDSNSVSVDCTITLRWQMQHRSNSNIILLTVTVIRASAFRIFRSSPLLSYVLLTRLSHAWAKKKKWSQGCLTMTVPCGRGTRTLSSPRPNSTRTTNRVFFYFILLGFLMPSRSGPKRSSSHKTTGRVVTIDSIILDGDFFSPHFVFSRYF